MIIFLRLLPPEQSKGGSIVNMNTLGRQLSVETLLKIRQMIIFRRLGAAVKSEEHIRNENRDFFFISLKITTTKKKVILIVNVLFV